MSLKSEINNLKFILGSGISVFQQNSPISRYNSEIINKKAGINKTNLKIFSEIKNLDDLQDFIHNSDICALKKQAKQTVFADGNPSSKIMLIGEAPGEQEDKLGKPFVGRAGQLLDKMLAAIELDRNKVYISNIVPWRPPGNRQPSNEEIIQCLPFIQKHIEIINPSMLILLGGTALKALMTTNQGITKLRGIWLQYNSIGLLKPIPTRAIFHPAFLLRSPMYKKETWEDLKAIKEKLIKNENN